MSFLAANVRPLDALASKPLLGGIAAAVNRELGACEYDVQKARVWAEYDSRFGERPDYRLWRWRIATRHLPEAARGWGGYPELLRDSFENAAGKKVAWGTLAVLAFLLDGWGHGQWRRLEANIALDAALLRRVERLACLDNAKVQCELIRLRILAAGQEVIAEQSPDHDPVSGAAAILDTVTRGLRAAFPQWQPGRTFPFLSSIAKQSLLVPYPASKLETFAGSTVSIWLRIHLERVKSVQQFSPAFEEVLGQANLLARSAWSSLRHSLRGQRQLNEERNGHWTNLVQIYEHKSTEALHNLVLTTAHVAKQDNEHFRTAALAHLLLRTQWREQKQGEFANFFSWRIRQAGLTIDERFADPLNADHIRRAREPRKHDPFWSRIIHDQTELPEWQILLEQSADWQAQLDIENPGTVRDGFDCLRFLAHGAEQGQLTDEQILRAAFRLAMRYGCTAWAAKLVRALRDAATTTDLRDFAHHLKRAQQTLPLGMDHEQQREWLDVLREVWHRLVARDATHGLDPLVLHEVLLGRSLQIVRDAERNAARLLALRYHDLLPDGAVNADLIAEPDLTSHGPATVNGQDIVAFLDAANTGSFGSPLCCSLVRIAADLFHLLVLARDANGRVRRFVRALEFSGLTQDAEDLREHCNQWLTPTHDGTCALTVDWSEQFTRLFDVISMQTRCWDIRPAWLMLAVEADLASLPWQNLARRHWPCERVLVTLVPSLGWAVNSYPRAYNHTKGYRLRLNDSDSLLQGLRFAVLDVSRYYPQILRSTAIVTGHGSTSREGLPLIDADGGMMRGEDWIDIGDYCLVIVHTCFGGHIVPGYLGNLGGVPGLTLGIRTRLLCAPVAEVPVGTALVLHHHHINGENHLREFGRRYLQAVEEDELVGLYNLYGFPDERVYQS